LSPPDKARSSCRVCPHANPNAEESASTWLAVHRRDYNDDLCPTGSFDQCSPYRQCYQPDHSRLGSAPAVSRIRKTSVADSGCKCRDPGTHAENLVTIRRRFNITLLVDSKPADHRTSLQRQAHGAETGATTCGAAAVAGQGRAILSGCVKRS